MRTREGERDIEIYRWREKTEGGEGENRNGNQADVD